MTFKTKLENKDGDMVSIKIKTNDEELLGLLIEKFNDVAEILGDRDGEDDHCCESGRCNCLA